MEKNNNQSINASLERMQYWSIFVYVVLLYIFNGNESYNWLMYIPVSIFSIVELGYIIKAKTVRVSKPILVLFLFVAICYCTCLWAQYKDIAMEKATTVFLLTIALTLMYNYCLRTRKSIDDILIILLVAGLFFAVYIIGYYGPNTLFSMFNSHYVRIGEEINNANAIGMELALTAVIAMYFGMNRNKKYYLLSAIPIILSLGTASKKAIIFIILGAIVLILFKKRERYNSVDSLKKIVLPIVILAAAFTIIQLGVFPTLTDRMNGYSNSFTGDGKIDGSTITRNKFIEYGLASFSEHPIFGIGIGNSGIITMEAAGRDTYLHNNYVELLATVGIIGTIVYYYIFVLLLILTIKNRKDKGAHIIIAILILCLALDWGSVSYASKNTYLYLLLCALFCSNIDKAKIKKLQRVKI